MSDNFTIDGRLKNLPDIQRQYNFELIIPKIGSIDTDGLILRVRTASIPARGNTPIESVFMGMKQYFPGQPTFGSELAVQFEEFEDQLVLQKLYDWSNLIFDINTVATTGGKGGKPRKGEVTADIILKMYTYNGTALPKYITFHNAFIKDIANSALGYAANESVKIDATFQFDYWTLDK